MKMLLVTLNLGSSGLSRINRFITRALSAKDNYVYIRIFKVLSKTSSA